MLSSERPSVSKGRACARRTRGRVGRTSQSPGAGSPARSRDRGHSCAVRSAPRREPLPARSCVRPHPRRRARGGVPGTSCAARRRRRRGEECGGAWGRIRCAALPLAGLVWLGFSEILRRKPCGPPAALGLSGPAALRRSALRRPPRRGAAPAPPAPSRTCVHAAVRQPACLRACGLSPPHLPPARSPGRNVSLPTRLCGPRHAGPGAMSTPEQQTQTQTQWTRRSGRRGARGWPNDGLDLGPRTGRLISRARPRPQTHAAWPSARCSICSPAQRPAAGRAGIPARAHARTLARSPKVSHRLGVGGRPRQNRGFPRLPATTAGPMPFAPTCHPRVTHVFPTCSGWPAAPWETSN